MEDDSSMCERILRSIEHIFESDPQLKEFTVIPTVSNTKNKSPVLYEEHTIGLESWCVKHVYRYAYLELFEQRKMLSDNKLSGVREHNLNHLLIGALIISPDVTTFWNMKRELVQNEILAVNPEFKFTQIVLSYKSKSNEAFGYRRWLCNRVLSKVGSCDPQTALNVLHRELQVTEMASEKSQNNYHSWTHRVWAVDKISPTIANQAILFQSELDFSHRWIMSHVSEHTGYHYRQYLIESLRKNTKITTVFARYFNASVSCLGVVNENNPRNILSFLLTKQKFAGKSDADLNRLVNYLSVLLYDLFETLEHLNNVFPNHESVWYYRRYLIYSLIKVCYELHESAFRGCNNVTAMTGDSCVELDYGTVPDLRDNFSYGETLPKLLKSCNGKIENCYLYKLVVKTELEFAKKTTGLQTDLANKHQRWLRLVLQIITVI